MLGYFRIIHKLIVGSRSRPNPSKWGEDGGQGALPGNPLENHDDDCPTSKLIIETKIATFEGVATFQGIVTAIDF